MTWRRGSFTEVIGQFYRQRIGWAERDQVPTEFTQVGCHGYKAYVNESVSDNGGRYGR
jgi:hypothetical protein